jgi:hypothetical protein
VRAGRRSVTLAALAGVAGPLVAFACKPNLDETVSLITQTRVLGVQATPAEGAPSASVTFTALVVDENGPVASPSITWDFCNARNPLASACSRAMPTSSRSARGPRRRGSSPPSRAGSSDRRCRR